MSDIFLDIKPRIIKLSEQSVPVTPPTNDGSLYLSAITGNLSIKKDTGAIIDLEENVIDTLLTTQGDIVIRDSVEPVRLPVGLDGDFLGTDGVDVEWRNHTKRLNIDMKDQTISTSYTATYDDNQFLNLVSTTGNDVLNLPDATTLSDGWSVRPFVNDTSTEFLQIKDFGGNVIHVLGISQSTELILHNNSTQNGDWHIVDISPHHILYVGKANSDYTSINDALNSITDNSSSQRYTLFISPGEYTETPITMKPFVYLNSYSPESVRITTSTNTDTIITAASNSDIIGIHIHGVSGSGGIGLLCNNVIGFRVIRCTFHDCNTGIKVLADTSTTDVSFSNCIIYSYANGLHIDGTALNNVANITVVSSDNKYIGSSTISASSITAEGPFTKLTSFSDYFVGDGTNGTAVIIRDTAEVNLMSSEINDFNKGVDVQNVGSAPSFTASGLDILNSATANILISHPTTTGFINGSTDLSNCTISSPNFSILVLDSTNNNTTIVGELQMGYNFADITNITDNILNASLGLYNGGQLTAGASPLDIDVESGIGYVELTDYDINHNGHSIKRLEWTDDTLSLSASTTNYIYVTNTNTITSSISPPNPEYNIFLGIVRTDGSDIEYISRVNGYVLHPVISLSSYAANIFKNQYVSGSLVTTNASRELAISSGQYYGLLTQFNPSGLSSPATFYQYYHSSSNWVYSSQTVVNNTQYDNGTNLTSLTASYYAKHILYIVGDSVNERYMLVIAQAQYATLNEATTASLPTPPPWFVTSSTAVTKIASIIIQEGVSTIIDVLDERPILGSGGGSGSSAVTDHGDLTGLLDDDHTQYLLVSGSRAMTGGLNMGSQSITNVNLVDGVDVSTHASRHLPNGDDPLTTAAPASNITISSTNTEGTANSFARSDHTHDLTLSINDISPLTTKGDLLVRDATVSTRLPVGTDTQVLTSDSSLPLGIKWASPTAATSLTYDEITDTATTTTTSGTFQVISGMTTTPAAGTYWVVFSSTFRASTNNLDGEFGIFLAGTIEAHTQRLFAPKNNDADIPVQTMGVITANGSQTIDVRWLRDTGTLSSFDRSLFLLRVA